MNVNDSSKEVSTSAVTDSSEGRPSIANMGRGVRLADILKLEERAESSGTLEDAMRVWTIDFYNQRRFWYYIFVGFTDAFEILFCQRILETYPAPSYSKEYFRLRGYLRHSAGIPPMPMPKLYSFRLRNLKRSPKYRFILQKLNHSLEMLNHFNRGPGTSQRSEHLVAKLGSPQVELTSISRQSKLSQEQLSELQRSTHFDKKELQQWYKGISSLYSISPPFTNIFRFRVPQGLPIWYAHKRRVPKDLQTILPIR
jgi:hypothetical protein